MARKILISSFYRLVVCNLPKSAKRDFIDVSSSSRNADVFYVGFCDEESSLIVFHKDKGAQCIECDSLMAALDEYLIQDLPNSLSSQILKPLLSAAFINDPDELQETFSTDEFEFLSADESDKVSRYVSKVDGADSIFVDVSVSYGLDAYFDIKSHKVEMDGTDYGNISKLYGQVDESDSWVIVLRPVSVSSTSSRGPSVKVPNKTLTAAETMFCSQCGEKIPSDSKFCGACGSKVAKVNLKPKVSIPEFKKFALGLEPLEIQVQSIGVEGPDNEGNCSVTVKYCITNTTQHDLDGIDAQVALLNSSGIIIEATQSYEDELRQGGTSELESCLWNIPSELLGDDLEALTTLIEATGFSGPRLNLGVFPLPDNANELVSLPTKDFDEKVRLLSGSLWKAPPDEDGDVYVHVKLSLQNLTEERIPSARLSAKVKNSRGIELIEIIGVEDIKPGSIIALGGYGYEKEKALKGAEVECAISYSLPVAQGSISHTGSELNDDSVSDEGEETETTSPFMTLARTLAMKKGAPEVEDVDEDDEDEDAGMTTSFTDLARTLASRNRGKSSSDRDEGLISMDPVECNGSFEINVFGRGGETVIGTISRQKFSYWSEHPEDLDEHFSGDGSEVDESLSLVEWSDQDDVAHCSGAEFTAESTRIAVTDANGVEIWAVDADKDLLEENGIAVDLIDEMAIYQLDPGYYFCGRAFEKGTFFTASIDAHEFDPRKLRFAVRDVNDWTLLVSVYYDDEEIDGADGYSTSTYSSEFFVEESES